MTEARVRLGFRNASDKQIVATASAVLAGLTDNPAFPRASRNLPALRRALDQFSDAIAAQPSGGVGATALKRQKRELVKNSLRKLAHLVEQECGNDFSALISSGFPAKSMSRTRSTCPKVVILQVKRGRIGELMIQLRSIPNAKAYEVRSAIVGSDATAERWQNRGHFTNSRAIRITELTPGRAYAIQARALGSTGCGEWSDPVQHMCA
jgi:hypothetical protein